MNSLLQILDYGQSIWYNSLQRRLITSGELQRLVNQDGLRGITFNLTDFRKAIASGTDYDNTLKALNRRHNIEAKALYESLAIRDVQDAADITYAVYEQTGRQDGFVSLEISPHLACDTQGMMEEARRLWGAIGRDNAMITIPATPEGILAITQLISEGININATLLFSQEIYECVAEAYIAGLEKRSAQGADISRIASVAGVFISPIDTAADALIEAQMKTATQESECIRLRVLKGKAAIANAKLAYQQYKRIYATERWRTLAEKGAQTQRLLWASTRTENPAYRDVLYVENLIGPNTVSTMLPVTLAAFRDHGCPYPRLEAHIDEANDTMEALAEIGISMNQITDRLLFEGMLAFAEAFGRLLQVCQFWARLIETSR